MILSGFHSNEKSKYQFVCFGIYYLQWRLVELPDMITRRLISVCLYDVRLALIILNSFCEVVHSRRVAARQ